MNARRRVPYGSWTSPISPEIVAGASVALSQVSIDGDDTYWIETRPLENGRSVLVRGRAGGSMEDVTPSEFNVRSRVHEYGGGAYAARRGLVLFTNASDQQIYRQDPGTPPRAVTASPGRRFADLAIDAPRCRVIAVREDHSAGGAEAANALVSVHLDTGAERVLASGHDFYSSPRTSPDGAQLAWLAWNHPNMPWDGTELWLADVAQDGSVLRSRRVAGGGDESIFQPEWSADGTLVFVSDRSGWWNLYRLRDGRSEPLWAQNAEFGAPQWVLGMSKYAFQSARRVICAFTRHGIWRLARLDTGTGRVEEIDLPYTSIDSVRASAERAVFLGGSPLEADSVVSLDLATMRPSVLRRSLFTPLPPERCSVAEPVEFPTEAGLTAHGLFYAPANPECEAPRGEKPPLLVSVHGGPAAAASSTLRLALQFWTSRGFAVLDVNYGGSTGYGRGYRKRLEGAWGIVDVDDSVNGALSLAREGRVDSARLAIHGGSAGGYTVLCALAFRDVFHAGASYFGVSDLLVLATDTHKFESRYTERLVGPFPERKDLYESRSPLSHLDGFTRPVIFFQGLDDKVVPPSQSERIVEALRRKGVPVAYLAFEGEEHGFRKAQTIRRAYEAELYFYGRIFGFELPGPVEPVTIENL